MDNRLDARLELKFRRNMIWILIQHNAQEDDGGSKTVANQDYEYESTNKLLVKGHLPFQRCKTRFSGRGLRGVFFKWVLMALPATDLGSCCCLFAFLMGAIVKVAVDLLAQCERVSLVRMDEIGR